MCRQPSWRARTDLRRRESRMRCTPARPRRRPNYAPRVRRDRPCVCTVSPRQIVGKRSSVRTCAPSTAAKPQRQQLLLGGAQLCRHSTQCRGRSAAKRRCRAVARFYREAPERSRRTIAFASPFSSYHVARAKSRAPGERACICAPAARSAHHDRAPRARTCLRACAVQTANMCFSFVYELYEAARGLFS